MCPTNNNQSIIQPTNITDIETRQLQEQIETIKLILERLGTMLTNEQKQYLDEISQMDYNTAATIMEYFEYTPNEHTL
jgi:hypothetical protein